jgi:PAS domain S-box-containing protein
MGIAIAECTGVMTSANDEFLRMIDYTRGDLKAGLIRFDRITPPEYQDLCFARLTQAVEQGSCTPYEKEYIRKDGSRVPVLCGLALIQSSPEEYIGFVSDLTRRNRGEAALRDRDRPFYALAETLPQLVWTCDSSGIHLYCNQSYVDYTGLASQEEVASKWLSLIHPEDLQRTFEAWSHALAAGSVFDCAYRLRRYDGVYRNHLANAVPVTNSARQTTLWVGTLTDIEDRKEVLLN